MTDKANYPIVATLPGWQHRERPNTGTKERTTSEREKEEEQVLGHA